MTGIFDVQGFGALSEWNGQFSSSSANQAFQTIASLGSNSIELGARIWTQSGSSTTVFADAGKTESDASLLKGFQAAEAAGLSVVFRPMLSSLDGVRTSSLAPSDVASFFASYKAEIVHLATIAQAGGVATFAIGNEMSSLSGVPYRAYWTDIIAAVREVYHGELTYSAATDEAAKVGFWDELDTIGVNTYPPLTSSTTPTVADLVHAWSEVPVNPYYAAAFNYKSPVDFLHSLSEQYGKQVLITEVGYRSIDGTAISPASWNTSGTANTASQADAYNAFFQVWTAQGGSWLKGVELWQWDLNNQYSATGYSVMGKPAEAIVSQYFHGDGATPNLNVIGSAVADVIDLGRGNDTITTGLGNDVIHGGAGDDVIVAGPATISPLTSTTVTLTGYGSVVNGIGAQVRVLVNGQVVSGIFEFKPATDPSGYQTFAVTFANPVTISSLDIELVNSASGRALHLKDISVNGVAVMPTDTTNASSPNSFDLYVRTIHLDATSHQDWFYGSGTDDDLIYGGAGNDTIDGGAGIDTAVYSGKASDYDITLSGDTVTVTDKITGRDGTDHLTNVEFLKFADKTISASLLTSNATASDAASLQLSGLQADQTIRHADGSHDVYISGITGKAYASQHSVVDASGHSVLIEQFRADGSLFLKQAVDAAGVRTVDQFDSAGHLSQETVTQTDGSYGQANYASDGLTLTMESFRHADGSRDIFSFGITGKEYTSQHVLNDASGHSVLIEQFRADDSLFVRQVVDVTGTKTLDQFDAAGHLAQETVTKSDGSYVQSSYDTDGDLTAQTVRHVDGSRSIDTFGITGQSYSARHDVLDSSGHRQATTFDNNDGSHTMSAGASGVTLTSTAGNDYMTSAGGDTFVFKQASGQDVINNFHVGEGAGHDTLQIDSSIVADIAQLNIHVVGHDTVIDFGHGASITLTGVVAPLTPHDLLIV